MTIMNLSRALQRVNKMKGKIELPEGTPLNKSSIYAALNERDQYAKKVLVEARLQELRRLGHIPKRGGMTSRELSPDEALDYVFSIGPRARKVSSGKPIISKEPKGVSEEIRRANQLIEEMPAEAIARIDNMARDISKYSKFKARKVLKRVTRDMKLPAALLLSQRVLALKGLGPISQTTGRQKNKILNEMLGRKDVSEELQLARRPVPSRERIKEEGGLEMVTRDRKGHLLIDDLDETGFVYDEYGYSGKRASAKEVEMDSLLGVGDIDDPVRKQVNIEAGMLSGEAQEAVYGSLVEPIGNYKMTLMGKDIKGPERRKASVVDNLPLGSKTKEVDDSIRIAQELTKKYGEGR